MSKTSLLDNLAKIKEIDKDGMLHFYVNAPEHYKKAFEIAQKIKVDYSKPKAIIVAGMGGSAIGGEILKDWGRDVLTIPIEVCREYTLPAYANRETMTFVISYSGETEETLGCFLDAIKKECQIFCICSGGTLLKAAEEFGIPALRIPAGIPPRAALPYLFAPMLILLEKLGLISTVREGISEAISALKQICDENAPEKPVKENLSKTLAVKVNGTIPVIYGFGFYRSVAQRFKQQFNENSKVPAFWNAFPELNHNEIVGWESVEKPAKFFSAVFIRDENESPEEKCRIEATKDLISGATKGVYEVWGRGRGKLAKILSSILVGDFTSVYLAILRGIDPTPVESISTLKKKLEKIGTKDRITRELQNLTR
ncbi:MAG: bifunctional phosphoglucose/phosphomannose isomerase [Candidatus Bathyarchaeia archaeon]|nr:bifunctional phosphoglucose/phosphomannose isomerase [Candidatus Bathyarchaeota archaeon]